MSEEGFTGNLRRYGQTAKEQLQAGSKEEREKIRQEATELIESSAHETQTPVQAQEWIYQLQLEKQMRMQELEEKLGNLESLEKEDDEHSVTYENGKYWLLREDGKQQITLGQMITDADWGVKYYLDPKTVPRATRKRYLVETTKQEVGKLKDKQLLIKEAWLKDVPKKHRGKQEAYKDMLRQTQIEIEELPAGVVAERMVRNFFRKLAIDAKVGFKVHDADPVQDVVAKTDFIIERPRHYRGVGTKVSDEVETLRVQLTTSQDKLRLRDKKEQVRKVRRWLRHKGMKEDIVLVTIPMKHPQELYEEWKGNPQPGGPDELWTQGFRHELFKRVMRGMLSEEEIEAQWQKIVESSPNSPK